MFGRQDIFSLFPLLDIVDDTLVTTHGVYLRGFELLGMDTEHLEIDVAARASENLYEAFKTDIPEGTFLQFLLVCDRNYNDVFERFESIPEPEDEVLAHQRRRRLDFLRGCHLRRYRIYVFAGALNGFSPKELKKPTLKAHRAKLSEAAAVAKRVRFALGRVEQLKLLPLGTSKLRTLCSEMLSNAATGTKGAWKPRGSLPENPSNDALDLRQELLTEAITYDADHVRIGRRCCKVLSLKALPAHTQFTMMEALFHTGVEEFRLSVNIIIPPQGGWKLYLARRRVIIAGMSDDGARAPNEAIEDATDDANLLNTQLERHGDRVALCGAQVVIAAPDMKRLEQQVDGFRHALRSCKNSLHFVEETGAHEREFFKTLPGMAVGFDRYRHRLGVTANAVDLLPLFANAPGDARPIFLIKNDRHELFSFDPMEPLRGNWNVVVLGASGAGKSVLANMAITTAMLGGPTAGRVLAIDFAGEEKSSYRNVVRLFNGAWVPLLTSRLDIGLSPFCRPSSVVDGETRARIGKVQLNFLQIVTDVLIANDHALDPQEALLTQGLVRKACLDLYREDSRTEAPLYSDLYRQLESYKGSSGVDAHRLARVLDLVHSGILEDPNAALLTRPSNLGTNNRLAVLDMFGVHTLIPRVRDALVYTVCHTANEVAFADGDFDRKYVLQDELAQNLRHKAMRDTVEEQLATSRKHRTGVWTITQKYEDYVKSGVAGSVAVNSDTKILLSHQNAREMEDLVVRHFSLKARAEHLFRNLRTKKGESSQALLLTKVRDVGRDEERDITAVLNIELSPFDYELATSDPTDRKRQQQYVKANPHLPLRRVLDYLAYEQPNRIVA